MLGGTLLPVRFLSFGRFGVLALLVAGACQGSKFGSAGEPQAGASGAGGSTGGSGGKGGKGGSAGTSTGGRGGSAGGNATGGTGTGGDNASGGAPEGGQGNEPSTGGTAGRGGAGGSAGKGAAGTGGAAGAGNTSGGGGSAGSAGSAGAGGAVACPAEPPEAMMACPEEQLGDLCYFDTDYVCTCDLRPELNSAPAWYCLGCPPEPVSSYDACAPVSASCTYDDMTCACEADGDAGTWRCTGCPPTLESAASCFPDGFPQNGCTYGNALCTCGSGAGFHCTGGCELDWFSFTDISDSDHEHAAWSKTELQELVAKINAGNNFVYTLPASSDPLNEHSHQVPFSAMNLWLLQSGLGEVEISTGLGDGHVWAVECMP